ncbi:MAG: hypothetical protein NC301_04580 [Bacteroides sp.]|nr:hypothetical protein [Bacteroides sp.]MCM1378481.1 hypothetical protein [Bacteroides sp.]MCM1444782.1 hypothetical protein [Prevotella sp.]
MNTTSETDHITLEAPLAGDVLKRRITVGLPSGTAYGERRFPVTPEGATQLIDRNIAIKMERGGGDPIHYPDSAYARAGVDICSRVESLRADVIISPAPLSAAEAGTLRRGTLLITLLSAITDNPLYAKALLHAGVNVMAADLIDHEGHRLIADILHEIDGCASIAIASALLTDPIHGKGILLGGVTGIVPCEVTVFGSGMGAIAAAHNALGMGATVRMFDSDLYSLRKASRVLNHVVISSAPHPNVVRGALRSADVVVVTPMRSPLTCGQNEISQLKRRALIFDLTAAPGATFPGIEVIDLATPKVQTMAAAETTVCYANVGCRVPRTAAMAMSNALVANMDSVIAAMGSLAEIPAAMRPAMLMFWGKCVNPTCAEILGIRSLDINLLTGN